MRSMSSVTVCIRTAWRVPYWLFYQVAIKNKVMVACIVGIVFMFVYLGGTGVPTFRGNAGDPHAHRASGTGIGQGKAGLPAAPANNNALLLPPVGGVDDRILKQLQWRLPADAAERKVKYILATGATSRYMYGQQVFRQQACAVDRCHILEYRRRENLAADAVIFDHLPGDFVRQRGQILIWATLEAPTNMRPVGVSGHAVNWTATYRRDSTFVTPYLQFAPRAVNIGEASEEKRVSQNYAEGKDKFVAWFVSNCHSSNGREKYVSELQKYLPVDVYGRCGPFNCSKGDNDICLKLLSARYRFYLAFENSNCKDYITEKLENALLNDVVPIVMGARPEDYRQVAPPGSYISVDDFRSPEHLAVYLHYLAGNNTAYEEYFRWHDTGEFINTKFWCRLCAMLHAQDNAPTSSWYADLGVWWGSGDRIEPVCKSKSSRGWASWNDD